MILIAIYSIIGDNRMSEFSNSSSYHVSGVPFVKTTVLFDAFRLAAFFSSSIRLIVT